MTLNNNFTYCTIKYKHCSKQRDCKRWIMNYTTIEQDKMLYNGDVWYMTGDVCVNNAYDMYIKIDS